MADYKLTLYGTVIRMSDGASIPMDDGNADYQRYLAWVDAGGVPDPADPRTPVVSVRHELTAEATTTDGQPLALVQRLVPTLTIMDVYIRVYGVDRDNGDFKKFRREAAIRRRGEASAPSVIGTVETPAPDVGTPPWTMVPSFVGNDLVITVTGAAGRTIDWSLFAEVRRFTPGGIE